MEATSKSETAPLSLPTPWRGIRYADGSLEILDGYGKPIYLFDIDAPNERPWGVTLAFAERAIQAVNAHDDLVAIAKHVANCGMTYPKYWREKAAAALTKAQGDRHEAGRTESQ